MKGVPSSLVQTRLPIDTWEWVQAQAKAAGLSVSAWLRVQVMQLKKRHSGE